MTKDALSTTSVDEAFFSTEITASEPLTHH